MVGGEQLFRFLGIVKAFMLVRARHQKGEAFWDSADKYWANLNWPAGNIRGKRCESRLLESSIFIAT